MEKLYHETTNEEYGTLEYWEKRYSIDDQDFDWFKTYDALKPLLSRINKESKILHLGCGNSMLSPDMYKDGYFNQINVDYSAKVIDLMKKKTLEMELMEWKVCDIFELEKEFPCDTFDFAIDKGTLDALLTKKHDPWDPEPELLQEIHLYLKQVMRVLKKGGSLYQITFAQPHFRKRFFEIEGYNIIVHKLNSSSDGFDYFCYESIKI